MKAYWKTKIYLLPKRVLPSKCLSQDFFIQASRARYFRTRILSHLGKGGKSREPYITLVMRIVSRRLATIKAKHSEKNTSRSREKDKIGGKEGSPNLLKRSD